MRGCAASCGHYRAQDLLGLEYGDERIQEVLSVHRKCVPQAVGQSQKTSVRNGETKS